MIEYWMEITLAIAWVSCALMVMKLDAVLCGNRTWEGGAPERLTMFVIAMIFWLPGVIYLLTCKHHVNNGARDEWGF